MRPASVRGALAGLLVASCLSEPVGTELRAPPVFADAEVSAGPHNVLSLVAWVRVLRADSVAVRFQDELAGGAADVTPAIRVRGDSAAVPVLGLRANVGYRLQLEAWGPGGFTRGPVLSFTTGPLPADLPQYVAGGSDPTPGFVVFAAERYGLAIDNTGRVVWYRAFPNGPGLNFMAQPTGHYTVRAPTPDPYDNEPWLELDALGNITRTFGCARGLTSRFHDLILEVDGSFWILCDETRTLDLTAYGGRPGARVTGTVVQHIGVDGALRFEWSAFDHFSITDLDPSERTGTAVNWTHANSLDRDLDGNLLVSFRSLGEITKIEVPSGRILWRLGGRSNDFAFAGTPLPPFLRQHSVRVTGAGRLLLLDNVGDPAQSRAERFLIDEAGRTARLAHAVGGGEGVVTPIGGGVQDLPGGRTLAAFGTAGRVEEYDADGRVVWSIDGNAGYVFRAQRIRSLYAPGVGSAR